MQAAFLKEKSSHERKWKPLSRSDQSRSPHVSLAHTGKHPIPIRACDTGVLHGLEIQNGVQMACLRPPSPGPGLSAPTSVQLKLLSGKESKTQMN